MPPAEGALNYGEASLAKATIKLTSRPTIAPDHGLLHVSIFQVHQMARKRSPGALAIKVLYHFIILGD